MGILDDAIREHLELKRQHGAAEQELQRQEEEALGPARRDVAPAGDAEGDAEPVAEHEAPETGETAVAEPDAAAPAEPAAAEPDPAAYEPAPDEPEPDEPEPEPAPHEQETMLQPEPEPPTSYDAEPPAGDAPGSGFDVLEEDDHVIDRDGDPEELDADADVLEDTPDFLQETPEHDRLWFEQKPPRDFDFD